MATNTTRKTTPAARKAATASGQQAARKAPAKSTAPAPAAKAATARKASPAPEQASKAPRVRAAQPYVRKDRTRRSTGSRVQVLDLLGADAPADAIKPTERDGKALNYAAQCVTHDTHTHHATYAAAYRAAKTSAEWCPACTTTDSE